MRNIKNYEGVRFEDPAAFGVLVEYFDNIALNKMPNSQNDSFYLSGMRSCIFHWFT